MQFSITDIALAIVTLAVWVTVFWLVRRNRCLRRRLGSYSHTPGFPEYYVNSGHHHAMPNTDYKPPVVAHDIPRKYFPPRRPEVTPRHKMMNIKPLMPDFSTSFDANAYPYPYGDIVHDIHRKPLFAPLRK